VCCSCPPPQTTLNNPNQPTVSTPTNRPTQPDMWQCKGPGRWSEMCAADPTLYACVGDAPALTDKGWWHPGDPPRPPAPAPAPGGDPGDGGGDAPFEKGPAMKMYFFNQMPFWLLFREWTPRTTIDLVGAWFAIFFLGVFYELVQVRERLGRQEGGMKRIWGAG
jgi:hypothetical protein